MSRRAEQIASTLRRAVQQVLTEGLNDPRLQAMITITDAHVDDSLSEAVMSVSVIPEAKQDLVIHGLKAAAGRIRRTAADEIDLKRAPRLIFRLDTSLKKQAAVFGALADVAREQGLVPGRDIPVRMICGHLGRESRETLSAAWGGVELYDWYGVGDTGAIAGQGPDQDGLYLMEDAQYVEVLGVDDGLPVADGEAGDMVVTCLYKDDIYPIIRFNTHDVTRVLTTPSSLGLNLRRIEGFLGRSDNMVKIRGINVFPQAMAPILEEKAEFAGEFICIASRDAGGRDELAVHVEVRGAAGDAGVAAVKHRGQHACAGGHQAGRVASLFPVAPGQRDEDHGQHPVLDHDLDQVA